MNQFIAYLFAWSLVTTSVHSQIVPTEITFHFVQFSVGIGKGSSTGPGSPTCTTFLKTGNKIISTECNSTRSDVSFIITNVQQEKNIGGIYSLILAGYSPDPGGNIPGFATYSFNKTTQLWSFMLEDVLDNKTDGTARTVLFYYNTQ